MKKFQPFDLISEFIYAPRGLWRKRIGRYRSIRQCGLANMIHKDHNDLRRSPNLINLCSMGKSVQWLSQICP
jgi:hypothetical protein